MNRSVPTPFYALAASAVLALALLASPASAYKVCIDPGHGGTDSGATGNGQLEKTNVLNTAAKFKAWLDKDTADGAGGGSWTVYRTRSTDVTVSLSGRCTYANGIPADRFMSIHNNAFNGSAHGIETFCYGSGSANSFDIRNKVYEEAIAMWPLTQRGTKTANYYVLVNTNMPAELHECAFIDNAGDSVYTGGSTHQDNHAKSEMFAIQRHYGYAKYTPQTGVSIIVDNASGSFSASANWYTSTSTPGYYGSNYHVRPTEAVSDAATWNYSLSAAGTYTVSAWWTAGANRPASAPFIVSRSGGTTTVYANQQANGGKWNSLGAFSIASGANTVKLSCWTTAGFYAIADAVKINN